MLNQKYYSDDRPKKSEIEIYGDLGASTPYRQGGSHRIIVPKGVVKYFQLKSDEHDGSVSLVFLATDQGVLIKTAKSLLKESRQ